MIKKLRDNRDLNSDDIEMIENWVIGDAEYYVKLENNFDDWIKECRRIFDLLKSYSKKEFKKDEIELLRLRAVLSDLKYTLIDISRYINAVERVEKFKSTIKNKTLDEDVRIWLADLIERQLYSEEF